MIDKLLVKDIQKYGLEILSTSSYLQTLNFIQHGNTTVFLHCIGVAYVSLKIMKVFKIKAKQRELVRSALLHDYFLYDWHNGRFQTGKLHGTSHPKIAMDNAIRDFHINKNEQDNIKKHMWPLTIVPPTKKEGWIIVMADKYCAIYEMINKKKHFLNTNDFVI